MDKLLILILLIPFAGNLVSAKSPDKQLYVLRSEKKLKSDVDYIHHKLEKLHPKLYWYISKKDLDYKFDSLKSTINTPMTGKDFFFKLSPVLASTRQGHLGVIPVPVKELAHNEKGTSPLVYFDFETYDNKLYIIRNNSEDKSILPGTEVVTVNGIKPQELISKYSKTISSDGFVNRSLSKYFPLCFYYQYGLTDSILCQLKFNETMRTVCLKRNSTDWFQTISSWDKVERNAEINKRRYFGYDELTKTYNKNLYFLNSNGIAVMKINLFLGGNYPAFYRDSFEKLSDLKTKTLVLDLRDNPGGNAKEILELYSCLVDSDFVLTDEVEVTSKSSLMHTNYFKGHTVFAKTIMAVFYPLFLGRKFFLVYKGANGKYYSNFEGSEVNQPNPYNFKGDVYVLINGGSFSASCILSADLKGSKRAVFVGEETGGAFNGAVAGVIPLFTLPKSKLNVCFGLNLIQPYYKSESEGRGIIPDIKIKPTLEDRMNGNDPELKWVLDEINGKHNVANQVKEHSGIDNVNY